MCLQPLFSIAAHEIVASNALAAAESPLNKTAWIAGCLLALLAAPSARSEPQKPDGQANTEQPLRRAVSEEAQLRREPVRPSKLGRLSPEERSKLRQDVSDAGRHLYPRPVRARY